jgi:ribosomal protein S18 acetylase RimI-like enzyme
MANELTFRPITEADQPLLREIYASTRAGEMAVVPWTEPEKAAFLNVQFEAQHKYYQEVFPHAQFSILEKEGVPVGRLYIDRREEEHRLIDIALLPEFRGKGLGESLMRDVLDEARDAGKLVRIHVEQNNPAMRLYKRLGFEKIEDQGVYYLMEWRP